MAKKIRRLKLKGQDKDSSAFRTAKAANNYIKEHAHYKHILAAIREGTSNTDIAEFMIARGLTNVNQKTMITYLQYFRRLNVALCAPVAGDLSEYDTLFDGAAITPTAEVELMKLIRLQKTRVAIDFGNERGINKLFSSTNKEITVLRELIMDLAKLRGVIATKGMEGVEGYSEDVKNDLKGLIQEENQRKALANMVGELVQATQ